MQCQSFVQGLILVDNGNELIFNCVAATAHEWEENCKKKKKKLVC